MSDVQIDVSGRELARLQSKLTPLLYRLALHETLTEAALVAEREARAGAPKDTSALARSITHEVEGATSARVSSTLTYAPVMEYGRRPGAKPPPAMALVGWMARHGITIPPFVLARSIARRGIRGRFFMRRGGEKTKRALAGIINRVAYNLITEEWTR